MEWLRVRSYFNRRRSHKALSTFDMLLSDYLLIDVRLYRVLVFPGPVPLLGPRFWPWLPLPRTPALTPNLYLPTLNSYMYLPTLAPNLYLPVLAPNLYLPALAPNLYLTALAPNLFLPPLAPNLHLPTWSTILLPVWGLVFSYTDLVSSICVCIYGPGLRFVLPIGDLNLHLPYYW